MSASRPDGSRESADDSWTPDRSSDSRTLSDGVSEISAGVKEIGEGTSKAVHGLVMLIVLLLGFVRDRDEEHNSTHRDVVSSVDPSDEFWSVEPLQSDGPSDVSRNVDEYLYSSVGGTDE